MNTQLFRFLAAAGLLLAPPLLLAQPSFQFNNRLPGTLVAPIYDVEPADHTVRQTGNTALGTPTGSQTYGGAPLLGPGYTAQLFIGPETTAERDLPPVLPTTVFSATSAGFIVPVAVAFPLTTPANSIARIQMRVWENRGGAIATWAQALADSSVARGCSDSWLVRVPSGPPTQSPMLLLRSFNVYRPPVLDWYTMDGGGGFHVGGAYTLSGTLGQPDAGTRVGGAYTLMGGFWGVRMPVKLPNAPCLYITRINGGAVQISWSATASNWFLKSTPILIPNGGSKWDPVPGPYPIVGTNCVVTELTPVGNRFFQLFRP